MTIKASSSGCIIVLALLFCAGASAKALYLLKSMVCEHMPNNQVWAQKGGICQKWTEVCKESATPCISCQVKYLTPSESQQRRLTWDPAKNLWRKSDGVLYDTAAENVKFGIKPITKYDTAALRAWGHLPNIWSLDLNGNLYVSAEASPGRFHHSSFTAGGPVLGAGQIIFERGRITHINNTSGHYQPDAESFDEVLVLLNVPPDAQVDYFKGEVEPKKTVERVDPVLPSICEKEPYVDEGYEASDSEKDTDSDSDKH